MKNGDLSASTFPDFDAKNCDLLTSNSHKSSVNKTSVSLKVDAKNADSWVSMSLNFNMKSIDLLTSMLADFNMKNAICQPQIDTRLV